MQLSAKTLCSISSTTCKQKRPTKSQLSLAKDWKRGLVGKNKSLNNQCTTAAKDHRKSRSIITQARKGKKWEQLQSGEQPGCKRVPSTLLLCRQKRPSRELQALSTPSGYKHPPDQGWGSFVRRMDFRPCPAVWRCPSSPCQGRVPCGKSGLHQHPEVMRPPPCTVRSVEGTPSH